MEECEVDTFVRPLTVPQYVVYDDFVMNDCEKVIWVCGVAYESWINESKLIIKTMVRRRFGNCIEKIVPSATCVFTVLQEAHAPPHDEHLQIEIDHGGVVQCSQHVDVDIHEGDHSSDGTIVMKRMPF